MPPLSAPETPDTILPPNTLVAATRLEIVDQVEKALEGMITPAETSKHTSK